MCDTHGSLFIPNPGYNEPQRRRGRREQEEDKGGSQPGFGISCRFCRQGIYTLILLGHPDYIYALGSSDFAPTLRAR